MEHDRERYHGWKYLDEKHMKTTSEWPQSGPVIPLSSNEAECSYALKRVEPRAIFFASSLLNVDAFKRDGAFLFDRKVNWSLAGFFFTENQTERNE